MLVLSGGGACKTRGKRVRPSCRGWVRSVNASTGSCFLSSGEGIFVRQSRERYTELKPLVRCLDDSWALQVDREGKDGGSLAAAGLVHGVAQATLRAARHQQNVKTPPGPPRGVMVPMVFLVHPDPP